MEETNTKVLTRKSLLLLTSLSFTYSPLTSLTTMARAAASSEFYHPHIIIFKLENRNMHGLLDPGCIACIPNVMLVYIWAKWNKQGPEFPFGLFNTSTSTPPTAQPLPLHILDGAFQNKISVFIKQRRIKGNIGTFFSKGSNSNYVHVGI